MVGELEVDRSGCALAIDLRLEGVQSRLVGFTRQALRQARVHGHQPGSVGQDGTLGCGEVCGQSIRSEVWSCGQGGHLALQSCDGCSVDSDGRGVCRVLRLRGVGCEHRRQLASGPGPHGWPRVSACLH